MNLWRVPTMGERTGRRLSDNGTMEGACRRVRL